MKTPPRPANESRRLAAVQSLGLLDTDPEERFDRITRMARRIFDTSAATVALIDDERQWIKSMDGDIDVETPRDLSFCAHAVAGEEPRMIVEDATTDERFHDNPLVTDHPNIRFYAGQVIKAPGGERIGTLCVIDDEPRSTHDFDQAALEDLAEMVEHEIATLTLAIGDELTGLLNRRGFEMLGPKVVAVADRMELALSAVYADLDNMKPINDDLGHDAGDEALVEVASLLESTFRASDLIARLGGDEFCALLSGAAAVGAQAAIERFQAALDERAADPDQQIPLSVSVGISTKAARYGEDRDLADLVAEADKAMLLSKRERKRAR